MEAEAGRSSRLPAPIRRGVWAGAALAVVVFAVVLAEGTPAGLLRRGPFSSDFFDAQAHALLGGRLDVDPDVAGLEGFVHDGGTHLYFGLVPAALRLPVAALTDRFDGRLTQLSMLLALAVALWATARLLWRARSSVRGDRTVGPREPWVVGGFVATVGLASPLLFLAARPLVYHEAELWGAATTLVALDAILAWWDRPGGNRLAVAGLGAVVALNARASVGSGAVAAVALTGALALLVRRVPWRTAPAVAAAVLAPVLVYGAVNQARFDHPFSVPFDEQVLSSFDPARQATLESTGGTLFGPEFAPTALVTYLRPDGVDAQRLFPWITFRERTPVIGEATFDTVDRTASLPAVAPSLVLLGIIGAVALVRRGWRDPWSPTVAGASAGLASTVTIAFIANRYLADFTPPLVLLAALGTWVAADLVSGWGRLARVAGAGALVGLTVLGTATSLALALQSQRLFLLPRADTRHDFVAFQYDLHEHLGGGAPPGVGPGAAQLAGRAGPRGEVVVLDDCRGLYWSDGARWWPLELGDGDGLEVTPRLRTGRTVLVDGGRWRIVADLPPGRDGHEVVVSFEHDDGTNRLGEPVERRAIDGRRLRVWLDRVNSEVTVTAGGRDVLVAWLVDLDGDAPTVGPGLTGAATPTPLCDDLADRLAIDPGQDSRVSALRGPTRQTRPMAGSSS